MKLFRQALLVAVLVGGLLVGLQAPAQATIDGYSVVSAGCSSATVTINYTRYTNDTTEYVGLAAYVDGDFLGFQTALIPTSSTSGQATVTAEFEKQPAGTIIDILIYQVVGPEAIDEAWYTYTCGVGPGCDVLNNIPEQAVVGEVLFNSELYWDPGESINPMIYVEAGNTYYVAGQDESETYYKMLISCEWVWVRKNSMGPNYDEVWNGAPLPTTVVE